ncbi:MAG: tyrosine--tRNA ligase [bacterium]|nr:tyrosine--tRNA ligase [bacterium]
MNKHSDILSRGLVEVLPSKKALAALMAKGPIRIYLGVDPTSPFLHLGHAIPLRKLREFQDLGHEVIVLFGTFTALIGDPAGKDKRREPLTPTEVSANMATYTKQAFKVLDAKKTRVLKNGDWLGKLKPEEILRLASHMTVSRLLERDMFQERMKRGGEVWVHEFLYPLLQGYDSVAMDVDAEIGGTDQTFNMLVGRRLQKSYRNREKYVLTVPLLMGLDGRKMSKSYGNTVNLTDLPDDMYGKLMSMNDGLVSQYVELCTTMNQKELSGLSPREAKARVAFSIVEQYHGKLKAAKAEQEFVRVFQKKEAPLKMEEVAVAGKTMPLADLLFASHLTSSKGEARRLVAQHGVKLDGEVQEDPFLRVKLKKGTVIQIGKRRFARAS